VPVLDSFIIFISYFKLSSVSLFCLRNNQVANGNKTAHWLQGLLYLLYTYGHIQWKMQCVKL